MAQIAEWISDPEGLYLVVLTGWGAGMLCAGLVMAIRAAVKWFWATIRGST